MGAFVSVSWLAYKFTPIICQQLKNLVSSRPEAQNIIDAANEKTNAADAPQQNQIPRSRFGRAIEETLDGNILTLDFVKEIICRREELLQDEWDILSPRIFTAPVESGYSALHTALVDGYTSITQDIIQLLIQCSEDTRNQATTLMIGVRSEGEESALRQAIRNGRSFAIIAFSALLEVLPLDMRDAPLLHTLEDCKACLDEALVSGSVPMIWAFSSLARWLPCDLRDEVLRGSNTRTN